jgi:hypothetical protein
VSARLVLTGGRVGSYSWIAPPCFIEFFKEFFCVTIGKITMLKMVAAGVTALFLSASPVAYAQASSDEVMERSSAANLSALTDARINIEGHRYS